MAEPVSPYGAGQIPPPTPSPHQKLVIFTEHRDTLNYLETRITTLLGRKEAVVIIHGGMGREERMKAQESFKHDPEVQVLLATDAAGEGINLQRAHLMVNYDLPWNPNRLEQRFGRIHRIGQTEVCHLWNLVAEETREGDVYRKLLEKLEQARQALGGQVFDVLGKLQFEGKPLRDLLIEAIRYGDQPEVRARLTTVLEHALDRGQLQDLLEERALAHDAMDASRVHRIREDMERAEARRLQPHYIESFFLEAFQRLGGTAKQREPRRYEITHVPAPVRNRDRLIGIGEPVLPRYERIAFEKSLVAPQGQPLAAFVCPGHPLLDSVIDLTLERHRDLLQARRRAGGRARHRHAAARALLPRTCDPGREPHTHGRAPRRLQADALRRTRRRRHHAPRALRALSRLPAAGRGRAGCRRDPRSARVCLDHPRAGAEGAGLRRGPRRAGAPGGGPRSQARADRQDRGGGEGPAHQGDHLLGPPRRATQAPGAGRQAQRPAQLGRGPQAGRPAAGAAAEAAGGTEARSPDLAAAAGGAGRPAGGADGLARGHDGTGDSRCRRRPPTRRPAPPGLAPSSWRSSAASASSRPTASSRSSATTSRAASPAPASCASSRSRAASPVRPTITVTRNEILYSLNKPDDFILAIVEFLDDDRHRVHYLRQPFQREPDFGVTSVNYDFAELLARAEEPTMKSLTCRHGNERAAFRV